MDQVQRSATFDIRLGKDDGERYPRIFASINAYRAALRHGYGVLAMAYAAGSNIEFHDDNVSCTMENDAAKIISGIATGQAQVTNTTPPQGERVRGTGNTYQVQIGIGPAYSLRSEITRQIPTAMAFVGDSLRRDLMTAWTAKDPLMSRADRGFLTVQGRREWAQFNRRGIGIPSRNYKLEGRQIRVTWDHDIGETILLLDDISPHQWHIWKSLLESTDGWDRGTMYLNEKVTTRDGKRRRRLVVTLSFKRPGREVETDPSRTLHVRFDGDDRENLAYITRPEIDDVMETIQAHDAHGFLAYHFERRKHLEERRGACGSPRRPWGFRKGWEVNQTALTNATDQRTRGMKDRNHAYTRRIISLAALWRCGRIVVADLPQTIKQQSWSWFQFKTFLSFKAKEAKIEVVWGNVPAETTEPETAGAAS